MRLHLFDSIHSPEAGKQASKEARGQGTAAIHHGSWVLCREEEFPE